MQRARADYQQNQRCRQNAAAGTINISTYSSVFLSIYKCILMRICVSINIVFQSYLGSQKIDKSNGNLMAAKRAIACILPIRGWDRRPMPWPYAGLAIEDEVQCHDFAFVHLTGCGPVVGCESRRHRREIGQCDGGGCRSDHGDSGCGSRRGVDGDSSNVLAFCGGVSGAGWAGSGVP